jgi:mRNA interferase MazF
MTTYIPQKGDFIAVTFDPQSGHEQRGRRPALVVSNTPFNKHTGVLFQLRPRFPQVSKARKKGFCPRDLPVDAYNIFLGEPKVE